MRTWQVQDVMTRDVASVREGTEYREIVDVLTDRHVTAAPVVDETRRVLGVVSEADLMYKVEFLGQPRERRILPDRHRREARAKAGATLAADLMTAPPVTITPDATIVEAARLMDARGVKRLPVVNDLGRLVGIVTRGDLLKVHLRPDAGVRRDVVEEVLWRSLGVRDGVVDVTVDRGVVTLTGQVERRSTAQLAVRLARQVSGVVEVVDALGYAIDDSPMSALRTGGGTPAGIA
ncbi:MULTISPECIES: CBS domain-containing protein [unclassified Micromonospora]|uniref:CBS domain-containing protein n=1 Tax=unclassified Micromonospora TaxID=2617518 RepID=UPI00188F5B07|nr:MULTISPECIES: CBS domain-containing protein [unclassified Micromonospora]MBF5031945.1 CBS domain-containing protein [Micromonospora sp. ANENR4]MCZ7475090.1 CBS domain-containing protein [Micromonospora sp. WMMC273]WBC05710.1 CBS domain-containing protein [Micromonospora sp. WMMA1976]